MVAYSDAAHAYSASRTEAMTFLALLREDRPVVRVALALVGISTALLAVNILLHALDGSSPVAAALLAELDLSAEGGLPEKYLHGLSFLTAGLFAFDRISRGNRVSLFLAALYLFVWFDDAALFHERLGSVLVEILSLPAVAGLRPQDAGEMLAWALAGAVFAALLPWAWRGRRDGDRGVAMLVAASFAALVICGIALDMVSMMLRNRLGTLIGTIEDAGEMLAVSATAVVGLGLNRFGDRYRRNG